jgi:hypothetical protein
VMLQTFFLAIAYLKVVDAFFSELRKKEPEVWKTIGTPGLLSMILLPFWRSKKYYAFLHILQDRAARNNDDYKYVGLAYILLKTGFAMCLVLLTLSGIVIFWIAYHDL